MNKRVQKSLLKSLGLNFLGGLAGLAPFLFLNDKITWGIALIAIALLSLLTQFIVSLVYIGNPEKKEVGQGMLISVGIILLIGFAVCGPMWF